MPLLRPLRDVEEMQAVGILSETEDAYEELSLTRSLGYGHEPAWLGQHRAAGAFADKWAISIFVHPEQLNLLHAADYEPRAQAEPPRPFDAG